MKKVILILLFFLINIISVYSQASVCETPKQNNIDLNNISINKCEIEKKENNSNKIVRTRIIRKRSIKKRFTKEESNQLKIKGNKVNLGINNNDTSLKLPNSSKEILFNLVEEIPMFYLCKKSTKINNIKCFNKMINNHFIKNFSTYKFIDETINDKIFIQFSIDIHGNVINPKIKGKNNNKLLNRELQKIINKLPNFTPGKEQGLPVIVTYSFPLNLTLN
ncbi:energy transducer TonB [uncultured Tenacibaculum sp.]|uniref:energy transducer TonB n=1 Tax=uncultured Tenacibaculum sp. TaxID=174713 RepID=UPI00262F0FFA|nr:energy transducer TonB [uncultured Tenacibaculum sp.]